MGRKAGSKNARTLARRAVPAALDCAMANFESMTERESARKVRP